MTLCLAPPILTRTRLSSLRARARMRWRKSHTHPELPNELWFEIFQMLDTTHLVDVSRVDRTFNAIALPIYLARVSISSAALNSGTLVVPEYRHDIFRVLQTAFCLPPIRKLVCSVAGDRRFQIISCLQRLIWQERALEEVHLTFYDDPFAGYGPPHERKIPRRKAQRQVARLLNGTTRPGRTLIVADDRMLVSGSEVGKLWRAVPEYVGPVRGIRSRARKAAAAMKKRTPVATDLVLSTACEVDGILCRDAHILERLHSLDIVYAAAPTDWTLVVLNAGFINRFSLPAALGAKDWASVLPRLSLPALDEFNMGRRTGYGDCELRDVACADLDAFLGRHPKVTALEYIPRAASGARSTFSLAVLPHLCKLTTTPAHFIHLHHVPNTFSHLMDLVLFAPQSTPAGEAQQEFLEVLGLLARTTGGDEQNMSICLRFPGTWLAGDARPPRPIHCVTSMVVFGAFPLNAPAFAEFLAPFAPALRCVTVHPGSGPGSFARWVFVDEVRKRCGWLEDVGCARWDSNVQEVVCDRPREEYTAV
ncbi:hypothetical protein B0H17DRAFT_1135147 [Mycena rosella]|uniref:F-box domain-containing protein n=1 Tax=Mycena rosella TaxID=1033263 RepID=A0AAD7GHJ7_MYCRO|nr:hypothetical protein B0H17DRAFT_1135147 [Mycena rosella]